ncbi:MAG: TonB-dependent receptor [Acidobacteriia bacterium]|nr:TonB-dependent receptor [Terriglobia bacterium]
MNFLNTAVRLRATAILILVLIAAAAHAQIRATSQLFGLLLDPSGASVQNQVVTIRSLGTDQLRSVHTGSDGFFSFAELLPGQYEVKTEVDGFSPLDVTGVELTVGQQARLDLHLQLATQREQETVVAQVQVSEPTRTELSEVIDPRHIEGLPINGRQYLDLVLLTPNVDPGRTTISNPATPGEPNQVNLSFSGLHESTNMVMVDGANNMNRVFGRSRATPSQEAVLEFRVLTDAFESAYGPAAAGVVTIVTKSGSNDLHGSLYEYFRNNALDARNILAPPGFDELRQNQFGGTAGGAIVKNRLFWFGNYEGQRHRESPSYSTVLLNNLPAINRQLTAFGLAPEALAGQIRDLDYDQAFVRADYQADTRNQLNATYRYRDDRDANLGAATNQLSAPSNFRDATLADHSGTANWMAAISPNVLNQATLQFAHHAFNFPSVTNEPHLSIANTLDMGRHFNAIDGFNESRFEIAEGITWIRGAHTFRAGGNITRTGDDFFYDPFDPAYAVFPNLNAFLGVAPFNGPFAVTFGFTVLPDGTHPSDPKGFTSLPGMTAFEQQIRPQTSQTHYGVFAQDQWRITPKLTLNYGVRWDVDRMPAQFFDPYYKAVQPRAGLAYSLNKRMTLRAGAGYYQSEAYSVVYMMAMVAGQDASFGFPQPGYGVYSNTLHSPFYTNPAVATQQLLSFLQTGVYPTLNPANFAPAQQFVSTVKKYNHGGPYDYQWNAQIDTELAADTVLSIRYLGLRGLELPSSYGGNVAPTNLTLANGMADYAIAPGSTVARTIDPLISPLSLFFDATGQSSYNAAVVSLARRFAKHYSLSANYTWSHTIDNTADPSLNGFPQDPYRRYLDRGNSKQDVPQRFVATAVMEGPSHGWLRDFRLAIIGTAQSGAFYTIYAGSDVNHDGNANTDRVGTIGRDTYRGDRLVNVDARLSRNFRLRENVSAQVIAEAFNVFNSLNVIDVNTVYGAASFIGAVPQQYGDGAAAPFASFGSIRATSPPRQIQFAFRLRF